MVYLFDPYCPWSYGYLPALAQLLGRVGSEVDLEVVNVGLYSDTPIADAPPPCSRSSAAPASDSALGIGRPWPTAR